MKTIFDLFFILASEGKMKTIFDLFFILASEAKMKNIFHLFFILASERQTLIFTDANFRQAKTKNKNMAFR